MVNGTGQRQDSRDHWLNPREHRAHQRLDGRNGGVALYSNQQSGRADGVARLSQRRGALRDYGLHELRRSSFGILRLSAPDPSSHFGVALGARDRGRKSVMDRRVSMLARTITFDERGAVLVEVSVVMTIMLVIILGSIEFLFVFYQRNAAVKAVQIGVRLAAVSDPIAHGLNGLSTMVVGPRVPQGSAMPDFVVTCDGGASRCTCSSGICPIDIAYNAAAMNILVFGRGSSSCGDAKSFYDTGMCDIFGRITPANVIITYAQ